MSTRTTNLKLAVTTLLIVAAGLFITSCETVGGDNSGVLGNELGSQPVNEQEASEYNRAVLRCYRTGGSRVVKIEGRLRCF